LACSTLLPLICGLGFWGRRCAVRSERRVARAVAGAGAATHAPRTRALVSPRDLDDLNTLSSSPPNAASPRVQRQFSPVARHGVVAGCRLRLLERRRHQVVGAQSCGSHHDGHQGRRGAGGQHRGLVPCFLLCPFQFYILLFIK